MRLLFILLIFWGIMLKQAYSQAHVVVFEIVDHIGEAPDVSEFSVDVKANGIRLADRWKTFNANTTTPCGGNKLTVKVDFQGFGPTTSRPVGTSYIATFKQTRAGKVVAQYELTTTLQPIGNNYFSCQALGAISLKPGLLEPMLSISSQFTNKERRGGRTFLATVSNVPADFLNKGYRIDWGDSGITTGTVKGAGPYEVTGHIGENFEAPAGEMKVRLLKDTSTVAEANLLPRAGIISVSNKEVCAGIKGEKIVANVTSWQPGYFIRWLDNSYHDEPRLVAINDTEVEIRGDFPAGTHTLWAWLFDDTGDIVATTRFTLTVKTSPVARIVTKSLCVSKGETFVLTAEASENCRYAWDYDLARSLLLDLTINGVMGDHPLQYVFSATDKTSGCVAQDTAIVRTGPAAPQVSIDTNTNRLDIKIHWTPVSDATAYHVYSRKWDPYCLTSENGGTYTKTVVTSTSYIRSASNVASDTLAFFYVTATNGTCESSASDTVGYVRHCVDATNSDIAINYVFPYVFDMSRYLAGNKIQHLLYYFFNGDVIRRGVWSYQKQGFNMQSYVSSMDKWQPFNETSDVVLNVGDSYLIGAKVGQKVEFVQSGYLKDTKISTTIYSTAGQTSNTPVWLPFTMADKNTYNTMTGKLWVSGTTSKLSAVARWNLQTMAWDIINALPESLWQTLGGPFPDETLIKPGFESILFNANEVFIWP